MVTDKNPTGEQNKLVLNWIKIIDVEIKIYLIEIKIEKILMKPRNKMVIYSRYISVKTERYLVNPVVISQNLIIHTEVIDLK